MLATLGGHRDKIGNRRLRNKYILAKERKEYIGSEREYEQKKGKEAAYT